MVRRILAGTCLIVLVLLIALRICSVHKRVSLTTGSVDRPPCTELVLYKWRLRVGRLSESAEATPAGRKTANLKIGYFTTFSGPSATVHNGGVRFSGSGPAISADFDMVRTAHPVALRNASFLIGLIDLRPVVPLLLIYPAIALYLGPYRRYRRRRKGRCVGCGYHLAGNVSGVCPECGHQIPGGSPGT